MEKTLDETQERVKYLTEKLVANHTPYDIIKHFRSELNELNVAFDLWENGKLEIDDVVREVTDVGLECNAFLVLLQKKFHHLFPSKTFRQDILLEKLDKFEAMLKTEYDAMVKGELEFPVSRYKQRV